LTNKEAALSVFLVPLLGTFEGEHPGLMAPPSLPALGVSMGEHIFHWPVSAMRQEFFRKGEWLFRKGDRADRMFYIRCGSIWLPEIKKSGTAGQIVGELGLFTPRTERTASAYCEADLEVYSMGRDEVIQYFRQDPSLALDLIQLSFKRFIENERAEAAAKERLKSELRIACDIQTSMLPREFPAAVKNGQVELCASIQPAKEIGGDFYDYFMTGKNRLCVLIGDASGKGIPAALFVAVAKSLLKAEASRSRSPAQIVSRVNRWLCPDNALCMFTTLLCVTLDTLTGEVECCHAGHEFPLVCRTNGTVQVVSLPCGKAVGVIEDVNYRSRKFRLRPGETLFVYTDGITEAISHAQENYSRERLLQSLAKHSRSSLSGLLDGVKADLSAHAQSEPQSDDITMLGLKFLGPGRAAHASKAATTSPLTSVRRKSRPSNR
jgi:phosphoserine phosphatase RsbU/P